MQGGEPSERGGASEERAKRQQQMRPQRPRRGRRGRKDEPSVKAPDEGRVGGLCEGDQRGEGGAEGRARENEADGATRAADGAKRRRRPEGRRRRGRAGRGHGEGTASGSPLLGREEGAEEGAKGDGERKCCAVLQTPHRGRRAHPAYPFGFTEVNLAM